MDINATLLGQLVSLAFFVWFCMKFVWPPILAGLSERQRKIEDGLNAAAKAQNDLSSAHDQVAAELKQAKQQGMVLIEQAGKRAEAIVEEAKVAAQAEAMRIKTAAQAELEQEITRAKDQLRLQVAHLAVIGAEKILAVEVDRARHASMLEGLAAQLTHL